MHIHIAKALTFYIYPASLRHNLRDKISLKIRKLLCNYQKHQVKKFYANHFKKIKNKKGKIKIGFLVSENQKWNCQSLYDELLKEAEVI